MSDLVGEPITGDCGELLNKYFLSDFRFAYKRYRGVCLPTRYDAFTQRVENMEVRNDDIWVMSYPKTGTTWTQEMVWCIVKNLDFEAAKEPLPSRFPFLEHSCLFDYGEVLPRKPGLKLQPFVEDSVGFVNNLKSPRFIKTHLPWVLLPASIRNGQKQPKIIYVCRNPKDTCVSYYHHCILLEGYKGNFEDFCKLFLEDSSSARHSYLYKILTGQLTNHKRQILVQSYPDCDWPDGPVADHSTLATLSFFRESDWSDGPVANQDVRLKRHCLQGPFLGTPQVCFSPFWSHIDGFWKMRNQPNVLFLKYEDMKKNLPSVIKETAKFLGKQLSQEQIDDLSDHLSFSSMKNNPAVNYEAVVEINRAFNLIPADGEFIRKGTGGEWKEKMNEDMIKRFDKWTEENLTRTGIEM